jgi:hypothetical protein
MTKITYLLGAGASFGNERPNDFEKISFDKTNYNMKFGGLPIVSEVSQRFKRLSFYIENHPIFSSYESDMKKYHPNKETFGILEYTDLLKELGEKIGKFDSTLGKHASFDTLARKYDLVDNPLLFEVKLFIDMLYCVEQMIEGLDKRYDLFFSTILKKSDRTIKKPRKIHILSWNYDIQIELSLSYFYPNTKSLNDLRNELRVYQKSELLGVTPHYVEDFSVIKLNGTIGHNLSVDDFLMERSYTPSFIIDFLLNYYKSHKVHMNNISFAWEQDNLRLTNSEEILKDSDILVVIGYSFPTFNREIDKQLLKAFFTTKIEEHLEIKEISRDKRIDLQVPNKNFDSIKTRIQSLVGDDLNKQLIHRPDMEEFFIPFEFE